MSDVPAIAAAEAEARTDPRPFWSKVRRAIGRAPFVEDAAAAWFCARDSETPARVRAVLLGALAYFVLPMDMIPDVILKLGFTDDAAVLMLAIQAISGHIRPAHRERARAVFEGPDPAAAARREEERAA